MLLYLTDLLIVEEDSVEYPGIYNALRNLASAAVDSYHMLLGDENIVNRLKIWFATDPVLRPLFDYIANQYVFGIPSFLNYYVEVVKENPQDIRIENGCSIAQMCYSDFKETKNVQRTLLIGEDNNDCSFFEFICKWFIRQKKLTVNFSFYDINGGGANTYREIEKALSNQQFSLTMVDTDISYPNQKPNKNSTYSKCKKVRGRKELFAVLSLNVHEIENLVPPNYIEQLNTWTDDKLSKSKQCYDSLLVKADEFLPYLDLKNGILLSKIKGGVNASYYKFAEKCYLQNAELTSTGMTFSQYCNSDLECGGKGNNDKIVYRGIFAGIMSKLLEKIKNESLIGEPCLCNFQLKCWNDIAQNMLNWGIARNNESLS